MYKHILIPTDGSALSLSAVRHGLALAKFAAAHVSIVTVTPVFHGLGWDSDTDAAGKVPEAFKDFVRETARAALGAAGEEAKAADVVFDLVHAESDHPYRAIIDTAQARHCDLIVMASHGRRGVSAVLLGSETVKVLTHSTIPVLVYR